MKNILKNTKRSLKVTLVSLLIVIGWESCLHICLGSPAPAILANNNPYFNYEYVDIFNKFFKKEEHKNTSYMYKTQRNGLRNVINKSEFLIPKPAGTKRIFIIGESVAALFSEDKAKLQQIFNEALPGINIEIIGAGTGAYDSYRVSLIQKELFNYSPDLIILFSGNNEFYEELSFSRTQLLIKKIDGLLKNKSWTYVFIEGNISKWLNKRGYIKPKRLPTYQERLDNYESNIRLMVRRAKAKNVPMVLCTLPVNFRDFPPVNSKVDLANENFFAGYFAYENKEYDVAIDKFKQYIDSNSNNAGAYFYLGHCYEQKGDFIKARECYLNALELDAIPGERCIPSRNKIIRKICAEENVVLADIDNLFIKLAPNGLLGNEFFIDNCHWFSTLNIIIADEIVRKIFEYGKYPNKPIFSPSDKWLYKNNTILREVVLKECLAYAENSSYNRFMQALNRINVLQDKLDVSVSSVYLLQQIVNLSPNFFSVESVISLKEKIYKEHHSDYDWKDFIANIDKQWPVVLMHISEAYRLSGLLPEALEFVNASIKEDPELGYAYLSRALTSYKMGQLMDAQKDFDEVEKRFKDCVAYKLYRQALRI